MSHKFSQSFKKQAVEKALKEAIWQSYGKDIINMHQEIANEKVIEEEKITVLTMCFHFNG